jgi:hypothetical protein
MRITIGFLLLILLAIPGSYFACIAFRALGFLPYDEDDDADYDDEEYDDTDEGEGV